MLKYAAERGDDDRIRFLLSQGADVNFQLPIESHSPLCSALAYAPSPFSTVKLLLEVGADRIGRLLGPWIINEEYQHEHRHHSSWLFQGMTALASLSC